MHPAAKCCSLYCSCVMVSGMIFFAILACMEANGNIFLTRGQTPAQTAEKQNVLYITIGVNLVIMISCIGCFMNGTKKEREEADRLRYSSQQNASRGLDIF